MTTPEAKAREKAEARAEKILESIPLTLVGKNEFAETALFEAITTAILDAQREAVKEAENLAADLLGGLEHMQMCGPCSYDAWEHCYKGKQVLKLMAKARAFLTTHNQPSQERTGGNDL